MTSRFTDLPRVDERRAYRVVDDFERELGDYTGAPYAVAVNSCTNALLLALTWERLLRGGGAKIYLPRRTYIGVLQSALNSGWDVEWRDVGDWQSCGYYQLSPTKVWDFARCLSRGDFLSDLLGHTVCLSFHSAKQLPLGRGGAILTDDGEAADWFRAARMDGRAPGDGKDPVFPGFHMPMAPDVAARGLDVLSRWNDKGYSPPPLPHEDYPDLSQWWPR